MSDTTQIVLAIIMIFILWIAVMLSETKADVQRWLLVVALLVGMVIF